MVLRLFKVEVTYFSGSLGEGSIGKARRWERVFSVKAFPIRG